MRYDSAPMPAIPFYKETISDTQRMPRAVSVEPDYQKTAGDSPSTILSFSFHCVSQIHLGQLSRKLQRIFGHTFDLGRGGSSTGDNDTCRQKTVSADCFKMYFNQFET